MSTGDFEQPNAFERQHLFGRKCPDEIRMVDQGNSACIPDRIDASLKDFRSRRSVLSGNGLADPNGVHMNDHRVRYLLCSDEQKVIVWIRVVERWIGEGVVV